MLRTPWGYTDKDKAPTDKERFGRLLEAAGISGHGQSKRLAGIIHVTPQQAGKYINHPEEFTIETLREVVEAIEAYVRDHGGDMAAFRVYEATLFIGAMDEKYPPEYWVARSKIPDCLALIELATKTLDDMGLEALANVAHGLMYTSMADGFDKASVLAQADQLGKNAHACDIAGYERKPGVQTQPKL